MILKQRLKTEIFTQLIVPWPQWPDSVNGNDKYSMTPLDIAAANGHFEWRLFS